MYLKSIFQCTLGTLYNLIFILVFTFKVMMPGIKLSSVTKYYYGIKVQNYQTYTCNSILVLTYLSKEIAESVNAEAQTVE